MLFAIWRASASAARARSRARLMPDPRAMISVHANAKSRRLITSLIWVMANCPRGSTNRRFGDAVSQQGSEQGWPDPAQPYRQRYRTQDQTVLSVGAKPRVEKPSEEDRRKRRSARSPVCRKTWQLRTPATAWPNERLYRRAQFHRHRPGSRDHASHATIPLGAIQLHAFLLSVSGG